MSLMYSKKLRDAIAIAYDFDPHILDLCDKGSPWLGRYLDDCSHGGISANTIMGANNIEELKEQARQLQLKKECYTMWYTEYKVQQ